MLNEKALDYWHQRLENWALWLLGGNAGASVVASIYSFAGHGTRGESKSVVLSGDASDTDALIRKLDDHLQRTLIAEYLETGTDGQKAHRLGVHRDTFAQRIELAKVRLAQLQHEKRARILQANKTSDAFRKR